MPGAVQLHQMAERYLGRLGSGKATRLVALSTSNGGQGIARGPGSRPDVANSSPEKDEPPRASLHVQRTMCTWCSSTNLHEASP